MIIGKLNNCPDCKQIKCICPKAIGRIKMKTLKQIVEEKVKEFEELDIAWDGKNLK